MKYDGFLGEKSAMPCILYFNPAGRLIELSGIGLLIKHPGGSSVYFQWQEVDGGVEEGTILYHIWPEIIWINYRWKRIGCQSALFDSFLCSYTLSY